MVGNFVYIVDFYNYTMEEVNKLTLFELQQLINQGKIYVGKLTPEDAIQYGQLVCS